MKNPLADKKTLADSHVCPPIQQCGMVSQDPRTASYPAWELQLEGAVRRKQAPKWSWLIILIITILTIIDLRYAKNCATAQ
jgi:hypothetical protein